MVLHIIVPKSGAKFNVVQQILVHLRTVRNQQFC